MTRGFALISPIMLAMLLASLSAASAQTAAPDPGAVAQQSRDIAGRWLGASDAAIQSLAKAGGSLTNIVTGKFAGLSQAIAIADWSATLGAASAGDVRGAVSGAAAIAIGGKVTAGGAALFGEAGAVAGGAIGTFFPVIGNIAGAMVGGAVGTAAGGFIAAFGYDKYIKDYVAKGVVAGIAAVIDPLPMAEMRAKMDALMLQAMSPEERAMLEASATFGGGEAQLLDFGTQPQVPTLKQPPPSAATPSPDAQQQAALPPGGPSTVTGDIQIDLFVPFNCTIAGGTMRCEGSYAQAMERWQYQFEGTISGSTAIGYQSTVHEQRYQSGCGYRDLIRLPARYDFEDGGQVRMTSSEGPVTVLSNTCAAPPPIAKHVEVGSSVHTWRARQ